MASPRVIRRDKKGPANFDQPRWLRQLHQIGSIRAFDGRDVSSPCIEKAVKRWRMKEVRAFDRKVKNREARDVASFFPFVLPHRLTAEDFGKRTELYKGHKRCLARKFSRTSI